MVDKIEMSLDEIIKTSRKQKARRGGAVGSRGSRRGATTRRRGGRFSAARLSQSGRITKNRKRGAVRKLSLSRGDVNRIRKPNLYSGSRGAGFPESGQTKLIVSNLDYGVSETDIRELFSDFGAIRNASVHYDRSGRSLGTAHVVFDRRADALKAIKQYNGVPLDGRPMNIQLATSDVPNVIKNIPGGNRAQILKRSNTSVKGRMRGRGGMKRGGRFNTVRRGAGPTAEQLDKELDAYVNYTK